MTGIKSCTFQNLQHISKLNHFNNMIKPALVLRLSSIAICVIVIAGCNQIDISGTYIQHDDNSAGLLQLTQSSDQKVTGTWKVTTLENDGAIKNKLFDLDGVIDGENLTFLIRSADSFTQLVQTLGKLNIEALDVSLPSDNLNEKFSIKHLIKGNLRDYDTASKLLAERGNEIITRANNLHYQMLYQLARQLTNDLDKFITRGKNYLAGKKEIAQDFFGKGIQYNEARLSKIKNLLGNGRAVNDDELRVIHAEMISNISITNQGIMEIEEFQHQEAGQEAILSQRISQFTENCFNDEKSPTDQAKLYAEMCKEYDRAVSSYGQILPLLHVDLIAVENTALSCKQRLEEIKREVDVAMEL